MITFKMVPFWQLNMKNNPPKLLWLCQRSIRNHKLLLVGDSFPQTEGFTVCKLGNSNADSLANRNPALNLVLNLVETTNRTPERTDRPLDWLILR